MKRILIILALICAAPLVSNAQLDFRNQKPSKRTQLASTKLGTFELKHDRFGFYLIGESNYCNEFFQMDLGKDKKSSLATLTDLDSVYDMLQEGEEITFYLSKYTSMRALKVGKNRLRLYPDNIRGRVTLSRNEVRKFQNALAAYHE